MMKTSCGVFKSYRAKFDSPRRSRREKEKQIKSREVVILSAAKDLTVVRFFASLRMTNLRLFLHFSVFLRLLCGQAHSPLEAVANVDFNSDLIRCLMPLNIVVC